MRRLIVSAVSAAVLMGCGHPASVATAPVTTPPSVTAPRPTRAPRPSTTRPEVTTSTVAPARSVPMSTVAPVPATAAPGPAPTTTAAPTTTEARIEVVVLRGDGLDRFEFGAPEAEVIGALSGPLGDPVTDDSSSFPVGPDADAVFTSADELVVFTAPLARTICWRGGLCATFGGTTGEALTLSGWSLGASREQPSAVWATRSGVTVGSRWSEHTSEITAQPGGCYTQGYGTTADGLRVTLDGGTWSRVDDEGTEVTLLPDPTDVVVGALDAGDLPVDLSREC